MDELTLTSSAFDHGSTIPKEYTCDGEEVNPPLSIGNIPKEAKSLVLIVDDPDIPEPVKKARLIEKYDHWILYNLPPSVAEIESPYKGEALMGINSAGSQSYAGPCPPKDFEPTLHRYVFQLYALDEELELSEGASESEVRKAMKGHILAKAELIGIYDRTK
jgi:Raf kinase inhibitor-like YbhB/YbcL family protein